MLCIQLYESGITLQSNLWMSSHLAIRLVVLPPLRYTAARPIDFRSSASQRRYRGEIKEEAQIYMCLSSKFKQWVEQHLLNLNVCLNFSVSLSAQNSNITVALVV